MVRVAIVDDDPQMRRLMRRILEHSGRIDVIAEHATGAEAVASLGALPSPEVLLMDMTMPGLSGVETARLALKRAPHVRVLAVTSVDDAAAVTEMVRAGASGYVLKTAPRDEIIAAVEAVAAGKAVLSPEVTRHVLDDLLALHEAETVRADHIARLDQMKRDFMNAVSHELKTPLTVIKGSAHTLDRRWDALDTASRRGFIASIVERCEHLQAMIDQILLVSGIERRSFTNVPATADVNTSVRRTLTRLVPPHRRRISLLLDPSEPEVRLDDLQLDDAVSSVVDNAVRHSSGPVSVSTVVTGREVLVKVADRGPGIEAGLKERILREPFVQGQPALTRDHGGLGMGLFRVNHIVASAGGRVTLESEVGAGTTVTLYLPRCVAPGSGSGAATKGPATPISR